MKPMNVCKNLHPVRAVALGKASRVINLKLVGHIDIEITLVLIVGTVLEPAKLAPDSIRASSRFRAHDVRRE